MSDEGDPATTIEALLEAARRRLDRLSPRGARQAQERGAALVGSRPESPRLHDGELPAAKVIARNVLDWRLDPASPDRDPELARRGSQVIVICDEGYQSSLVAATLRRFGLDATDVVGGAQSWIAAGLPVERT